MVESTLGRLVDDAARHGIGSPAIVVIGAIAGLRRQCLSGRWSAGDDARAVDRRGARARAPARPR